MGQTYLHFIDVSVPLCAMNTGNIFSQTSLKFFSEMEPDPGKILKIITITKWTTGKRVNYFQKFRTGLLSLLVSIFKIFILGWKFWWRKCWTSKEIFYWKFQKFFFLKKSVTKRCLFCLWTKFVTVTQNFPHFIDKLQTLWLSPNFQYTICLCFV